MNIFYKENLFKVLITLVLLYFVAKFSFSTMLESLHYIGVKYPIKNADIAYMVAGGAVVLFIGSLCMAVKTLLPIIDYLYLFYRFFKPYTKDTVNAVYLDESIDIDFIYNKMIPYSEYKNNKVIDQHINIDRLLKQRRPLDMEYEKISFSDNEIKISFR